MQNTDVTDVVEEIICGFSKVKTRKLFAYTKKKMNSYIFESKSKRGLKLDLQSTSWGLFPVHVLRILQKKSLKLDLQSTSRWFRCSFCTIHSLFHFSKTAPKASRTPCKSLLYFTHEVDDRLINDDLVDDRFDIRQFLPQTMRCHDQIPQSIREKSIFGQIK